MKQAAFICVLAVILPFSAFAQKQPSFPGFDPGIPRIYPTIDVAPSMSLSTSNSEGFILGKGGKIIGPFTITNSKGEIIFYVPSGGTIEN